MRNLLGKASAAQNLDGDRLKGSLLGPLKPSVVPLNPSSKGSPTARALDPDVIRRTIARRPH